MNKLHKDLEPDEIAPIVLREEKIITNKEYLTYIQWLYAIGIKPNRYEILYYKLNLNGIYKKQKIIDAYENRYLKFYKVKRTSRRYKIATKIYKMLKEIR